MQPKITIFSDAKLVPGLACGSLCSPVVGETEMETDMTNQRQHWKLGAGLGVGRCSSKSLRKRGSRMTPEERKDLPG